MKAIIDGKRYDTDTATLIYDSEWFAAGTLSDFAPRDRPVQELRVYLWRTPRGNWFRTIDSRMSNATDDVTVADTIYPESAEWACEYLAGRDDDAAERYCSHLLTDA